MNTETPAYCRKEKTEDPILANYRFFINEKPHMSQEGYKTRKKSTEWEYVNPTHHQETLRLAVKFNELTDMEAIN